jgi:hypothetical protein
VQERIASVRSEGSLSEEVWMCVLIHTCLEGGREEERGERERARSLMQGAGDAAAIDDSTDAYAHTSRLMGTRVHTRIHTHLRRHT